MTLLTALRTAATSAYGRRHSAPKGARTMALIGNGAQAEFQALAMKAVVGIDLIPPLRSRPPRNRQGAAQPQRQLSQSCSLHLG